MDRSSRQKSGATVIINDKTGLTVLIDIFGDITSIKQNTHYLNAHEMFSRIDYILGYKNRLSTKNIDIISSIFSDHSGTKLKVNHRKK